MQLSDDQKLFATMMTMTTMIITDTSMVCLPAHHPWDTRIIVTCMKLKKQELRGQQHIALDEHLWGWSEFPMQDC